MLKFLADAYRRHQLKTVAKALPHLLAQRYNPAQHYTAGQVATTAGKLKIDPALMPYAFAIACNEEEFLKALPDSSGETYGNLRAEFGRLFSIDVDRLNAKTLTSSFRNPVGPSPDRVSQYTANFESSPNQ